jgi:hypothetical protein
VGLCGCLERVASHALPAQAQAQAIPVGGGQFLRRCARFACVVASRALPAHPHTLPSCRAHVPQPHAATPARAPRPNTTIALRVSVCIGLTTVPVRRRVQIRLATVPICMRPTRRPVQICPPTLVPIWMHWGKNRRKERRRLEGKQGVGVLNRRGVKKRHGGRKQREKRKRRVGRRRHKERRRRVAGKPRG